MKFSGIEMEGYFKAQIVANASFLPYTSDDEGRIVYDEATKSLWIADDTDWKSTGEYNNIPENSVMWVYADSPPDGWSLFASSGDRLLAIKGGSTYNVGSQVKGSWATPSHQHSLQNHTHTAQGNTGPPSANNSSYDTSTWSRLPNHYHPISSATSGPSTNVTGIGGSASTYRPRARVGILCSR